MSRAFFRLAIMSTVFSGAFFIAPSALAAPANITYTYLHHIITIPVALHPEWKQPSRQWFYHGVPALPPSHLKTCGEDDILEPGWTYRDQMDWNEEAIGHTIATDIATKIDRDPGSVVIHYSGSGAAVFEGKGITGQRVDISLAASLTQKALSANIATVVLPVSITQPTIDIRSPELESMGIREVVTVGESVFAKSPVNRRHNITVGVEKFNGHIVPQGDVFSFVEVLGPVNENTGYRKELVINGDTTLPDYGGGLCQVSTTAFRGPWEYGLPILQRKNHSYAVSYYSPQGTDATIYPPNVDIKFQNDTPSALLIQSYVDDEDRAFFIYYGTRDGRSAEIFGPYITDRVPAPTEEKISYTTEIPVGERRKAGERHDGMNAVWYRTVRMPEKEATVERFASAYQARPLYWQIGVTPEEMQKLTPGAASVTPSWLPRSDRTNESSSASN